MKNLLHVSVAFMGLMISMSGIASHEGSKTEAQLNKIFKDLEQNEQWKKRTEKVARVAERRKVSMRYARLKNLAQGNDRSAYLKELHAIRALHIQESHSLANKTEKPKNKNKLDSQRVPVSQPEQVKAVQSDEPQVASDSLLSFVIDSERRARAQEIALMLIAAGAQFNENEGVSQEVRTVLDIAIARPNENFSAQDRGMFRE